MSDPIKQDNERPDQVRDMLSLKQVLAKIPVSRTTIWRMSQEGKFPKARHLTQGRVAWYADEVAAWQKQLDAA